MVVFIRVLNAGYAGRYDAPILLMNTFAPLIDYIVVERNTQSVSSVSPLRLRTNPTPLNDE